MVNKKGFIKIIEAFLSIMLLLGLILLAVNNNRVSSKNSDYILQKESDILSQIQMNNTLRQIIIQTIDYNLTSNDTAFNSELANYTKDEIIGYDCYLKICPPEGICNVNLNSQEDLYAREVLIVSSQTEYNPKKLKIFCTKNA